MSMSFFNTVCVRLVNQEDEKEEETQQDQRGREVGVMGTEREREESKRNPLNSFEILSKYIYLVSNMFPFPLVKDLLY